MKTFMAFPICSLLFLTLVAIVYFVKPKLKTIENMIYKVLLITVIIGLILEILCYFAVDMVDKNYILSIIILKLYVIYIFVWTMMFNLYVLIVTSKSYDDKSLKTMIRFKKTRNFTIILTFLVSMIMVALPINIFNDGKIAYTYGPITNLLIILCFLIVMIWIIKCIINIKNIFQKKYVPIVACVLMLGVVLSIQAYDRSVLIATTGHAFIILLMFFTIENPDLKLINELELAKNQAEKANRAKTDFLSSMSHEIRTPLNAIVGLSNVIKESSDLDEIHDDATDVVNASNTLLEIVNGILDISRIEADKMEIINVDYNPLEEFKTLANLTETRIGEKEIKLRTNFAIDLPETLYGDRGKIKQIATNLLTNAVKYTEKGYIDFKVNCINEGNISRLTISVSDTGRGIKKEQIDTLFTKFNRLEEDKNTTIEGTGLGLAITKSLVELMGGKIVVDSTYGEGSKFTVFLTQNISTKTVSRKVETIDAFAGKKVLVVDDNKLNLKVSSKIMKEFDLDIDTCESGFECIEKVKNNNDYDIIFMDIMMPKMSGIDALNQLKNISDFNTPVVALTADAIEGKDKKYLEMGFADYLSKPIEKHEINKVLNRLLNKEKRS